MQKKPYHIQSSLQVSMHVASKTQDFTVYWRIVLTMVEVRRRDQALQLVTE